MRINSGNIGMDSARTYFSTESSVRSFSATTQNYVGTGSESFGSLLNAEPQTDEGQKEDTKGTGTRVEDAMEDLKTRINRVRNTGISDPADDVRKQIHKLREECINYLLRLLFPDRYFDSKDVWGDCKSAESTPSESSELTASNIIHLSYTNNYYYEESETTNFSCTGKVNCADGREIDFNIDLMMSRSFTEYCSEEIDFLDVSFKDPLIINLDGNIPELSDQTFFFDIDCDGVEDEISRLISGSGFLALDKNGDGTINDGSELFGALTGNGFDELSQYDEDGDGFIDEDDEIFNKLKVWAMDENGTMQLYSLKEAGVGAIGLKNVSTAFSLNSLQTNESYGVIRSTGMFLYENGNVGTVQQVDLALRDKALRAYA